MVAVVLDKAGRDMARQFQKEFNTLLKSKDSAAALSVTSTRCEASLAVLAGKCRVEMDKHRNRNVDMRRALSFNLRSKHTRKQDRQKMMMNVGRTQPQRRSVFEPMVFALARLEPERCTHRIGCIQSKVLKQVNNAALVLNKSLPVAPSSGESWVCPFKVKDPMTGSYEICKQCNPMGMRNCSSCGSRRYDIPHASTLRGRAAIIARRLAKTPKMPDKKSPLVNTQLCSSWGGGMFDPKRVRQY
jgi:hypothetical protein